MEIRNSTDELGLRISSKVYVREVGRSRIRDGDEKWK
jgi:hypothetical protein